MEYFGVVTLITFLLCSYFYHLLAEVNRIHIMLFTDLVEVIHPVGRVWPHFRLVFELLPRDGDLPIYWTVYGE